MKQNVRNVMCLGLGLGAVALFAGCAGSDPEPNALGITEYRVSETTTGISIVGLAAGVERAEARLDIGTFRMPVEDRVVFGRSLTVKVDGHEVDHVSEGFTTLNLPLPSSGTDFAA